MKTPYVEKALHRALSNAKDELYRYETQAFRISTSLQTATVVNRAEAYRELAEIGSRETSLQQEIDELEMELAKRGSK